MTRTSRFQVQSVLSERDGVTTYQGLDPLTGLPVLVYRFMGNPRADVGTLESENIPGILSSAARAGQGQLVVAYSRGYQPVEPGRLDVDMVLDASRALRDAAASGVVHGDIRPERLLVAEGHLLVEGFGVPWPGGGGPFHPPESEDRSFPGDVYALSKSLLELAGERFPHTFRTLLQQGLEANPNRRPTAAELHASLEHARAAAGSVHPGPEADRAAPKDPFSSFFEDLDHDGAADLMGYREDRREPEPLAPGEAFEIEIDLETPPSRPGAASMFADPPAPHGAPPRQPPATRESEPLTINTDPGISAPQAQASHGLVRRKKLGNDEQEGFIKDLPPGATYRAGEEAENLRPAAFKLEPYPRERPRGRAGGRFILLALFVVVAGGLAYLAFLGRGLGGLFTPPVEQAVRYVVDVGVEPGNLPPVTLRLVQAPEASSLPTGSILGSAPRKVVLDQAGSWTFQGEFGQRVSEPVTIQVPDQQQVILTIPEPEEVPQRP